MLKRLVKQRKHLSLARKSFKNQENIKRKQEARNIRQKGEVSGPNGRVGNLLTQEKEMPKVLFKLKVSHHFGENCGFK